MHSRRDALTAFAELALAVEQIGYRPQARWPGDHRHGAGYAELAQRGAVSRGMQRGVSPSAKPALEAMEQALHQAAEAGGTRRGGAVERIFDYAPIAFDAECLARSEQAAALGYSADHGLRRRTRYLLYQQGRARQHDFIPCEKALAITRRRTFCPNGQKKGPTCCCNSLRLAADEPLAARRKRDAAHSSAAGSCRLMLFAVTAHIDRHRRDNNDAFDNILHVSVDADEGKAAFNRPRIIAPIKSGDARTPPIRLLPPITAAAIASSS
jgi:hypothetical protein